MGFNMKMDSRFCGNDILVLLYHGVYIDLSCARPMQLIPRTGFFQNSNAYPAENVNAQKYRLAAAPSRESSDCWPVVRLTL